MLEIKKSLLEKIKNVSSVQFDVYHKGIDIYWDKEETKGEDDSEIEDELAEFWYINGGDLLHSGTMNFDNDLEGCSYESEDEIFHIEAEETVHFCTSLLEQNLAQISSDYGINFELSDLFLNIQFSKGELVSCSFNDEKNGSTEYGLEGELKDKISTQIRNYVSEKVDSSFAGNMTFSIFGSWIDEVKEEFSESFSLEAVEDYS